MEPLDPSDPARIGPYTLSGRLGTGGMGSVYLGRSAGGRTVAVKLVRADLADDPAFRARFRGEVEAARAVAGAFTAPVVGADPDAPVPWMATAFVPGISLHRAVTEGGPLPGEALRALTAGIAEALVNIHAAGLMHRDLTPGNVLLALDGPHVIDFGIARAAEGTALTAAGTIVGTPAYMSPEQAQGLPLTPASDVFSLGATLAFAASGEAVFGVGSPGRGRGEDQERDRDRGQEILHRVVHAEPDLSAVPEDLRLLVAACLSKSPADRPTPRQVVTFVERGAAPHRAGAWLPPRLITAIEEAAAVMGGPTTPAAEADPAAGAVLDAGAVVGARDGRTSVEPDLPTAYARSGPRPGPKQTDAAAMAYADARGPGSTPGSTAETEAYAARPATPPLGPHGAPHDTPPAPDRSRRTVLLWAAGGAVALGAGGAVTAWLVRDRGAPGTPGPDLTDRSRLLDTATVATSRWTAPVTAPLLQVVGGAAGETVVAVGTNNLWAFDRTGRPRWGPLASNSNRSTFGIGGACVVVGDGTLFAIDQAGIASRGVKAVDLATGTVAWTTTKPQTQIAMAWAPGTLGGLVYVTGLFYARGGTNPLDPTSFSAKSFVWAVEPASGRIRWEQTFDDPSVGQAQLMVPSTGNRVIRATVNPDRSAPKLSGLDVENGGKAVWEQPAPGGGNAVTSTASVRVTWADGPHCSAGGLLLYLNDRLYAIDPANGQVVWRTPDPRPVQAVVASADGATVYAAQLGGQNLLYVYALEARTGTTRWAGSLTLPAFGTTALQCADGQVYVWSKGQVWALSEKDGAARWTYHFGDSGDLLAPAAFWAGGGQVYGPGEGGLVAVPAAGT
ncbi:serine/threonine-protein kinase [Streptomyces sp. NPDC006430]|uniref:serine/threonine-protein kinase n=1 Tax=Streptomyces sp. NPDC006430 TaxID=3154299 RepID=UPI0033B95882